MVAFLPRRGRGGAGAEVPGGDGGQGQQRPGGLAGPGRQGGQEEHHRRLPDQGGGAQAGPLGGTRHLERPHELTGRSQPEELKSSEFLVFQKITKILQSNRWIVTLPCCTVY